MAASFAITGWSTHSLNDFDVDLYNRRRTLMTRFLTTSRSVGAENPSLPSAERASSEVHPSSWRVRLGQYVFHIGKRHAANGTVTGQLIATRSYSAVVTELGMIDAGCPLVRVPIVYAAQILRRRSCCRRAELEPIWSRVRDDH